MTTQSADSIMELVGKLKIWRGLRARSNLPVTTLDSAVSYLEAYQKLLDETQREADRERQRGMGPMDPIQK